jgi:hypothetical protein
LRRSSRRRCGWDGHPWDANGIPGDRGGASASRQRVEPDRPHAVHPGPGGVAPAWSVADDEAAEDLATELRAVGRRTRETLLAHGLDERARTGGRFSENPPTLEWICFHVLAE